MQAGSDLCLKLQEPVGQLCGCTLAQYGNSGRLQPRMGTAAALSRTAIGGHQKRLVATLPSSVHHPVVSVRFSR